MSSKNKRGIFIRILEKFKEISLIIFGIWRYLLFFCLVFVIGATETCVGGCSEFLDYFSKKTIIARGYLAGYPYYYAASPYGRPRTVVYLDNGESFTLDGHHDMPCKIGERIRIMKIRKRYFLEAIKD